MEKLDAGLRGLDHYKTRLPFWRYYPRQWLIPLLRWETPYLASLQKAIRTPTLDSYFALVANLGTHTFFMIFLPIMFWCGHTALGRGSVHILASGVFFSGFIKDLLCLPRPLSPPLQRITMSGSAALEYGFPSTHSTNAVSVAVYAIMCLRSSPDKFAPVVATMLEAIAWLYAISIVAGRVYCGMHGFFDVVVGSLLGAALSIIEVTFVEDYERFLDEGSLKAIIIVILIILVLVRIHPEPADDCPCFDDSVAFAGVLGGVEFGVYHYALTPFSWNKPVPATVPFDLEKLGWLKIIARICLGILLVFVWRSVMKFVLLKVLPPIFRIIERLGLTLPRKFFKRATEYDSVPKHLKTDNVMPSVSEIPNFLSRVRHPRRSRSISVGPQSAADAYEALAFRREMRKERQALASGATTGADGTVSRGSAFSGDPKSELNGQPVTGSGSIAEPLNEDQVVTVTEAPNSLLLGAFAEGPTTPPRSPSQDRRQNEKEEREILSSIPKPRVRYDVEVITKLIVYSGIGWIAVEAAPILFQLLGLGLDARSSK